MNDFVDPLQWEGGWVVHVYIIIQWASLSWSSLNFYKNPAKLMASPRYSIPLKARSGGQWARWLTQDPSFLHPLLPLFAATDLYIFIELMSANTVIV